MLLISLVLVRAPINSLSLMRGFVEKMAQYWWFVLTALVFAAIFQLMEDG